eukprot:NODE_15206_length_426_cov_71.353135_g14900_i0.p2 GENE.NODE_15206_length_426_cov_71.353135_g14900_i0~~NODE_15206_length_426_cov_71.353135_g14900_i0.p2  ORF type:complete len:112 (-),score=11.64 NODE_15206_length_426_cov_71.353135_g14900_i0:4-339(-)
MNKAMLLLLLYLTTLNVVMAIRALKPSHEASKFTVQTAEVLQTVPLHAPGRTLLATTTTATGTQTPSNSHSCTSTGPTTMTDTCSVTGTASLTRHLSGTPTRTPTCSRTLR